MSDGLNKVILLGNLGADPELRYTGSGVPVLSFRLATKETWVDKNHDRQERTEWHSVVLWGSRGEALAKHLYKGSSVLVEGGLRTSSYEKDGQKRYKTEVHAREILFAGRRATPVGSDAGGPPLAGPPLAVPPLAGAPLAVPRPPARVPSAPKEEQLDELPY
jgi:single-strand DNA-binding protein